MASRIQVLKEDTPNHIRRSLPLSAQLTAYTPAVAAVVAAADVVVAAAAADQRVFEDTC